MAAPPEKRVELMNAFKRRLFEMNRRERMEAIRRLRGRMASDAPQHGPAGPPPAMHPVPEYGQGYRGGGASGPSRMGPSHPGGGAGRPAPAPSTGSPAPHMGGGATQRPSGAGGGPREGTGAGRGPHRGMPGMGPGGHRK
jgi:hypothetical protein